MFVCVALHEFGLIAAALRFGIKTPDITLLPIGGVARLERNPSEPREELLIAVAGPLVNVVIAALLLAVIGGAAGLKQLVRPQDPQIDFFVRLAGVNIVRVLFNMIPAFPMDCGRVLRAILAWRWSWERATRVAATIGQGTAFAMVWRVCSIVLCSSSSRSLSIWLLNQITGAPAAAVVSRSQHPVGIMNYETIGEMLMLRAAVHDFRFGMLRRSRVGV